MTNNGEQSQRRVVGFLGIGLDNEDEHKRLTRTEHFFLVGGSEATHERMQETAIRFTSELQRRGKELEETPLPEIIEIFHECRDQDSKSLD